MEVKKEIGFEDLKEMCWEGAIDTLNTVEENGKEEELMEYLKIELCGVLNDRIPTETEVNDELWFNDSYIFEYLGIKE
jgi:hypothetical protein